MYFEASHDLREVSYRVDARLVLKYVEAHGLRQGPALSDGDDVSLLYVLPARRAVHRHVLVALLEPAQHQHAPIRVNTVMTTAPRFVQIGTRPGNGLPGLERYKLIPKTVARFMIHSTTPYSPAVLGDVVEVVAADDDGVGHLAGRDHQPLNQRHRQHSTSSDKLLA